MESIINNSFISGQETLKERFFENVPTLSYTNENIINGRWWKPSENGKKRVMLCGTYPIAASNGYSKVVYYISKYLGGFDDIDLTVYGFQNFVKTNGENIRNDIPKNVKVHDAYLAEEPRRNGFGELEIASFLKKNPQDVIIIFNDNMITSSLTANIVKDCWSEKSNFKLVSYMDQVYPYQKKEYINILNKFFDAIIAFTPYWKDVARELGIKHDMDIYCFPHGFDEKLYYPVDMKVARMYYGFDENAFMVLNLNRNQPRKRWDIAMIAWAEFVAQHYALNKNKDNPDKITSRPIKLVVGTLMNGYWDLMDILENECKIHKVPFEYAKNTVVGVSMPQRLSDREINILYNSCDVGLNCADGEGFGLCGFEGAALGKAQVSSNVGGMKEFLSPSDSILIEPATCIYLDNKSKGIGGKAEIANPKDFAKAFWKYFNEPDLVVQHGRRSRENILTNYRWDTLVKYFHDKVLINL